MFTERAFLLINVKQRVLKKKYSKREISHTLNAFIVKHVEVRGC